MVSFCVERCGQEHRTKLERLFKLRRAYRGFENVEKLLPYESIGGLTVHLITWESVYSTVASASRGFR
jgi:hypothetical protein